MKPIVARCGAATLAVALALGCGSQEQSRTYVSTLGSDTLTVERITRTADRVEGVLVERSPYTHVIRYSADLAPDGTVSHFEASMSTPPENPEGPEAQSWTVDLSDGSAVVTRTGGENAGTTEIDAGPSAIPAFGRPAMAMWVLDQALRQADMEAAEGEEYPLQLVQPTSPRPSSNAVSPHRGDTVTLSFFGLPIYVWSDDGALAGVSGRETTMKVETREVEAVEVEALASEWAAMDARGEGMGVASPPATTTAMVDGVSLEIRYSQPAKRGREIWGGLVPYDEVWRTGANAATHLTTDGKLMIGELEVPAGTYTLWSTFTDSTAHLIINNQTDQWGTQYDAGQDLGRTPMTRTELDEPVERFTISVDEGALRLDWDRTRFSVPVR